MTSSKIEIWHCDAACDASAPEGTEGWYSAIYTHGCPAHAEFIQQHKAKVTNETRGRGAREVTTWFLRCGCDWAPRPNWANHTATHLREAHIRHLAAEAAGLYETVGEP